MPCISSSTQVPKPGEVLTFPRLIPLPKSHPLAVALELTHTDLQELVVHISSHFQVQWHRFGSLKTATMGIFIP